MTITTDIIVLDDEAIVAETLASILEGYGYACTVKTDARSAISLAAITRPKLFITDLKMPELTGLEVLAEIKRIDARIPVLVVTGYGTIHDAVSAMKDGAFDFIAKPFNIDHIAKIVSRALRSSGGAALDPIAAMEQSRRQFLSCYRQRLTPEMQVRVEMAALGMDRAAPVAIVGEPATGKSALAGIIHSLSKRSTQPFLTLDCARHSEAEQISILFATRGESSSSGLLELAAEGTVLIESVEKASISLLERLEHLLRFGEFTTEEGATLPSSARILMTCNARGTITSDCLPAGLRPILGRQMIVTPSLSKRKNDILPFAEFYLRECCTRYGRPGVTLHPDAANALIRHEWKGNLHELENVIERATVLAQGSSLTLETLPLEIQSLAGEDPTPTASPKTLKMMQTDQVLQVMSRNGGDREKTAAELGISIRTLYRKISRAPKSGSRNESR